jgi:hypothetical protein
MHTALRADADGWTLPLRATLFVVILSEAKDLRRVAGRSSPGGAVTS